MKRIDGTCLLYINGEGIDHVAVESVVKSTSHYTLGPFCWLVNPPTGQRECFFAVLQSALSEGSKKAEILVCPLSDAPILETHQDGFGIAEWLKNHGSAVENP